MQYAWYGYGHLEGDPGFSKQSTVFPGRSEHWKQVGRAAKNKTVFKKNVGNDIIRLAWEYYLYYYFIHLHKYFEYIRFAITQS